MKNGKKNQIVHRNVLVPSDRDMVDLARAVEDRFMQVLDLHYREKGFPLTPPTHLQSDVVLWRKLRMRHKEGDQRHTEDEKRSTRRVAQWTLDVKCLICNQPMQTLAWKD